MNEISLQEYCAKNSQSSAAKLMNCTPGAVWQMLKYQRLVKLVFRDCGDFDHAYEKSFLVGKKTTYEVVGQRVN